MPDLLATTAPAPLSDHFLWIDWLVLVGYMAVVTVLGVLLAGKQEDMEDFFRGGNKLPWYAVSASMIATIISAVTFVAVPAVAFAAGGNFTYLQLGIIAGLISRLFVAFVLVPAYYKHRVYSPYDYMGQRLGEAARSVTTALFSLMGLLAQASRVYLSAIVLALILDLDPLVNATGIGELAWCIIAVGIVSILWTMLGGIATVVWTDALLFLVFVVGALTAIGVVAYNVDGGLGWVVREAANDAASGNWGKFTLFNLGGGGGGTTSFTSTWGDVFADPLTLWAAIFAVTFGNIGAYGTDQLLAQRIFTCRNQSQAKLAVLSSYAAEAVAGLMLFVGVGLWAYYRQHPLSGAALAAVETKNDNVFPVFILSVVPTGLTGLIVAGIFAAAISSLTSILAAFSQTSLSAIYLPLRDAGYIRRNPTDAGENRRMLRLSRGLIVIWGVLLSAVAFAIAAYDQAMTAAGRDVPFLFLALGLASYVIGALLAAFLLAWLPLKVNAFGLIWSAPLSVFTVYASRFHDGIAAWVLTAVCFVLLVAWFATVLGGNRSLLRGRLLRTPWLLLGLGLMMLVWWKMTFGQVAADGTVETVSIAWPWYAPIGGFMAFTFGYLLADRYDRPAEPVAAEPARGFEVVAPDAA